MSPCGEDVERCSVLEKVTRELLGVRRVLDLCNIIALCPFLMLRQWNSRGKVVLGLDPSRGYVLCLLSDEGQGWRGVDPAMPSTRP